MLSENEVLLDLDEMVDLEILDDFKQMEQPLIFEIWEIYEILFEIFFDEVLVDFDEVEMQREMVKI